MPVAFQFVRVVAVVTTPPELEEPAMPANGTITSLLFCCLFGCLSYPPVAAAQGSAELNEVVAKVAASYGGDKLTSLTSFSHDDDYRETFDGQGYTPEYDNFWVVKSQTRLDLKNKRGSYESWSDQYGRIMQFHTLSTAQGVATIDYELGYYTVNPEANYYQSFGRNIRSSDTLLAYELVQPQNEKSLAAPVHYLGELHDQIVLTLPATSPLHLYVNQAGEIKRMHRDVGNDSQIVYVFENHSVWNGLRFAKEHRIYIDGSLLFLTRSRSLIQRPLDDDIFRLPGGLNQEPERVSFEETTVIPLSDTLHQVGQDNFSAFYDAGEYIIGMGGYGGLSERFEAYQANRGHNKPLRFQIPTHHHLDHTEGLADAIELGATLIVPERLKTKIMENTQGANDDQVRTFATSHTIDGLQLFTISTSHTEVLTVIYEPASKTLFQADHYAGFFKGVPTKINRNSYTLYQGLVGLGLDIENLLSVHSGKVEAWMQFERAAKRYTGQTCFMNRSICAA